MTSERGEDATEKFMSIFEVLPADKLKDKAKSELNESSELKDESLQQLKVLINDHNVVCNTRDEFLLRFLRTKKFEVHRSFDQLRHYSTERAKSHDALLGIQWKVLQELLQQTSFGALPYRDFMGRIIVYRRMGIWSPSICTFEESMYASCPIFDFLIKDPMTQISGTVVIFDFNCFSLNEVLNFLRHAKFCFQFLFDALPVRVVAVHAVNFPTSLKWVYEAMKPFLSEKIKKRVHFHEKETGTLCQHISPAALPFEFGGTNGPLNNDHLIKTMQDCLIIMKEEQQFFVKQESTNL